MRRVVPTIVAICVALGLVLGARPVDDRARDPHAAQLVAHRVAPGVAARRHAAPSAQLAPFTVPLAAVALVAPRARAWSLTVACVGLPDAPRPACSARGPPVG